VFRTKLYVSHTYKDLGGNSPPPPPRL
jgi:hypothetical protein